MKIVIDAHMLGYQEGGNETYVAGLLQGFESCHLRQGTSIIALFSANYKRKLMKNSVVVGKNLRNSSNFSRLFVEIPRLCRLEMADLLHVTYNVSPFIQCPSVISVHDVIFRLFPEYFSPRVRLLLSTLMPLSMWRANAVITISETSKQDILRFYPFVRHKIVVIPLAAGPLVDVKPDLASVQKYTNGDNFILAVGNVQPRKNLVRLVQAYILLRERQVTKAKLIIAGRSQWQGSEIQRIATNSLFKDDIIFTGYLEDTLVAALFMACSVFVYPSLYEGFGLPVLEAMKLGAPVITSHTSSIPSIAGDAAILIDPLSVEQISLAMERVLINVDLQEKLREQGLHQAARFSWERTAQETLEVYKHFSNDRKERAV